MTRPAAQDQLRYCERCGISFLWSAEEQKARRAPGSDTPGSDTSGLAPLLCAGCRTLLPPPGRERGVVKWYNFRKRYGFIVRQQQPELFVHGSDVEDSRGLRPGDLVEFSVGESERGPTARALHILAPGEATVA